MDPMGNIAACDLGDAVIATDQPSPQLGQRPVDSVESSAPPHPPQLQDPCGHIKKQLADTFRKKKNRKGFIDKLGASQDRDRARGTTFVRANTYARRFMHGITTASVWKPSDMTHQKETYSTGHTRCKPVGRQDGLAIHPQAASLQALDWPHGWPTVGRPQAMGDQR